MKNEIEIVLNTMQIERMVSIICNDHSCAFNLYEKKGSPYCLLKEVQLSEDGTCNSKTKIQ